LEEWATPLENISKEKFKELKEEEENAK